MLWAKKQKGFTIVELLIVVVVIAILAAITIVAYNGIQNRAKSSVAQSEAGQAARKVALWQVENPNSAPASLAAAGYTPSGSTTQQYTPGSGSNWCATLTVGNISYFVSHAAPTPASGACVGHSLNGVPPIVNLVDNPSLESNASGWMLHSSLNGAGAIGRIEVEGEWVFRGVRSGSGATAIYFAQGTPMPVNSSSTYTASIDVTSSVSQWISLLIRIGGTSTSLTPNEPVFLNANVPTRLVTTSTTTASTSSVFLAVLSSSGSVGDVITVDNAMLTEGSTAYPYADGNTPNWSWTGSQNNSTSAGPPLTL